MRRTAKRILLAVALLAVAAGCSDEAPKATPTGMDETTAVHASSGIDAAGAVNMDRRQPARESSKSAGAIAVSVGASANVVLGPVRFTSPMEHIVNRQPTSTHALFTFELLGNQQSVPSAFGVTFEAWHGLIDLDVPPGLPTHSGTFANEPSASTTIRWDGAVPSPFYREITFERPVNEVSLFYAGCGICPLRELRPAPRFPSGVDPKYHVLTAYDAAGAVVDQTQGLENFGKGTNGPDDPTGPYNKWDPLTVRMPAGVVDNKIVRVRITGYSNYLSVDDVSLLQINFKPVAITGGPYTASEGAPVQFDGSASFDPVDASGLPKPNADAVSYQWDFGDGGTSTLAKPSYVYASSGSFTASLTVTDPNGATDIKTTTVTVANVAPAVEAGPGAILTFGETFTLNASFHDPGGAGDAPYEYTIDWGDGSQETGSTNVANDAIVKTHTYATADDFTVTVSVTDRNGGSGSDQTQATVQNAPPTAEFAAASATEGVAAAFDGSNSSDPEGEALTYAWTFGDGGTASGATPAHTFADDGTYDVILTVADPHGLSATRKREVTVANAAPTVTVDPVAAVVEGESFTLSGTAADPGTADAPWSYTIDWGDGASQQGQINAWSASMPITGTHTYAAPGSYPVTVTVADKDGSEGTAQTTVEVESANAAPTAIAAVATEIVECTVAGGGVVALDGGGSSDPDGDPLTFRWTLGGDVIATSASASVTLPLGSHTITLRASDPSGLFDEDPVAVEIRDTAPPTVAGSVSPGDLWPPNHKYHTISVSPSASDACTASSSGLTFGGYVVSNEPDEARGDGNHIGDIRVTRPDGSVLLSSNAQPKVPFNPATDKLEVRAERSGTASGRVYSVHMTATDASGNTGSAVQTVTVGHDRGNEGGKDNGNGKGKAKGKKK